MSIFKVRAQDDLHTPARMAGLIYLVVIVAGVVSLVYVPRQLSSGDDAARAVEVMIEHEGLLRIGIASEILCQVAFLILPFALCRIFWGVDRSAAILMTALAVAGVPLAFANMGHNFRVLKIVSELQISALEPEQAGAMIASARAAYFDGLSLLGVFWGLWLLPLGYLVVRSGILPIFLGALLMLRGADYVINVFVGLFAQDYSASLIGRLLGIGRLAEILFCAWLLIFGARRFQLGRSGKTLSKEGT